MVKSSSKILRISCRKIEYSLLGIVCAKKNRKNKFAHRIRKSGECFCFVVIVKELRTPKIEWEKTQMYKRGEGGKEPFRLLIKQSNNKTFFNEKVVHLVWLWQFLVHIWYGQIYMRFKEGRWPYQNLMTIRNVREERQSVLWDLWPYRNQIDLTNSESGPYQIRERALPHPSVDFNISGRHCLWTAPKAQRTAPKADGGKYWPH